MTDLNMCHNFKRVNDSVLKDHLMQGSVLHTTLKQLQYRTKQVFDNRSNQPKEKQNNRTAPVLATSFLSRVGLSPLSDLAGLRTLVSREPQGLAFVRAGSDRFRMACFVIQKPVTKRQKLMRGPHNGALKGRIRPLQGRIRPLQGLIRLRPVREPFEAM